MRKKLLLILFVILLAGITSSVLAFTGVVRAEELAFSLPWSVIGAGGMGGSAGGYTIHSTLGQPVAGAVDGGTYHLTSGFWTRIIESFEEFLNFLPLIVR